MTATVPLPEHAVAESWTDVEYGPDVAFRCLRSITYKTAGEVDLIEASAVQNPDGALRDVCVRVHIDLRRSRITQREHHWEDELSPAEVRVHAAQWRAYATRLMRLANAAERAADIAEQWEA